jgi:hypothetical protein
MLKPMITTQKAVSFKALKPLMLASRHLPIACSQEEKATRNWLQWRHTTKEGHS